MPFSSLAGKTEISNGQALVAYNFLFRSYLRANSCILCGSNIFHKILCRCHIASNSHDTFAGFQSLVRAWAVPKTMSNGAAKATKGTKQSSGNWVGKKWGNDTDTRLLLPTLSPYPHTPGSLLYPLSLSRPHRQSILRVLTFTHKHNSFYSTTICYKDLHSKKPKSLKTSKLSLTKPQRPFFSGSCFLFILLGYLCFVVAGCYRQDAASTRSRTSNR